MTVINAVPAGTDIKLIVLMLLIMLLKDVYCICLAVYSCTEVVLEMRVLAQFSFL